MIRKSSKRPFVPVNIRNKIIKKLIFIVEDLNTSYSSIFHLKKEINKDHVRDQLFKRFNKIKEKFPQITLSYLFNHFSIILDIKDFLFSRNLKHIAEANHCSVDYIRDLAKLIIPNSDHYYSRFIITGVKSKEIINEKINGYARQVIVGKINEGHFNNLTNQYFQIIKDYYRSKFKLTRSRRILAICKNCAIQSEFIDWIEGLNATSYDKIFNEAGYPPLIKSQLIDICEKINFNDEIFKFIIYSIIKKPKLSRYDIARSAGVADDLVYRYGKVLDLLENPITKEKYIDLSTRFSYKDTSFTGGKKYNLDRKKFYTVLSIHKRNSLIGELNYIIERYKRQYRYEFVLKELLNFPIDKEKIIKREYKNLIFDILKDQSEIKSDKFKIIDDLKKIATKFFRADFHYTWEMLNILLDIKDFVLGGNAPEIAKKYKRSRGFIIRLARTFFQEIIQNPSLYEIRFYNSRNFQKYVLQIAEGVVTNRIDANSFDHLILSDIQDLMREYRYYKGFQKDIALFRGLGVGLDFPNWIKNISPKTIIRIIGKRRSKIDLLVGCLKINKNWEVLKYIIYSILETTDRRIEISQTAGKNPEFVTRCAKILESNTSPSTSKFFLTDYKLRFPKGSK